ncbi:hypothetical protein FUAX_51670 (plasmid) [Fulvitalea axinellae]|uniref:histidine kinase n=1 Tax=Fulvitalea axinellae TaxID=1182444 RepID=A0AAU9DJQ6_9BACT|nr:hypothetical protein FUAX_51670 [Fulvitalea axinellae]
MADWQNPETFALWLSMALGIVVLLAGSVVAFTRIYFKRILFERERTALVRLDYQKQLLKDSVKVQERERSRIASELHDGLISKLNVILMAQYAPQGGVDQKTLLSNCITQARRLSHDLKPPMLEEATLGELVEDFAGPLEGRFDLDLWHSESGLEWKDSQKLQVFRILQELVNNTVKHADASAIRILTRVSAQGLVSCVVSDNGRGFNAPKISKGLGMKNIELRTQSINAEFRFRSNNGGGTCFVMAFVCELKSEEKPKVESVI